VVEIYGRLHEMFRDRLHVDVPAADTDLLEGGLLDSLRFVALLTHVESEFGISIPLADLELDRVSTLGAIAEVVHELTVSLGAPSRGRGGPGRLG